jgi:SAM-dependent methyltransferase
MDASAPACLRSRPGLRALAMLAVIAAATGCGRSGSPKPADDRERRAHANEATRGQASHGSGDESHGLDRTARTYEGRPIAPTCSHLGAGWLERPEREDREQPDRVLDALRLDARDTVADVGAGTGYFTVRLARRVARVHATDVQPEMLEILADRIAKLGLTNVELHRAGDRDAALPARCCDLVLLVDVYHELSDPPAVMAGVRRALTERGRLVLVEYRGEDPAVAILPEHKMTLPRIQHELGALGFRFVESLEFLPDQRIVIFTAAP